MGSDVTVAATQRRGWRGARTRVLLVSMLAFLIAGVTGSAHLTFNNPSFMHDAAAAQDPANQDPAPQEPAAQAAVQAPADEAAAAAPAEPDADTDGMPDAWETFFGLNPASNADAGDDPDNDGLTNLQEFQTAGHPFGAFKRYFAEGSTGFFDTSFGIVNLNATDVAHVQLTFMGEAGVITTHRISIPAGQRTTVSAASVLGNNTVLGTVIESDKAMVADRLIRWGGNGYGSAVDAGAAAPSTTWYLAEGSTGLFQLYYLLLNPGLQPATVTVKFLRESGGPITKTYTVPAQSRSSVFVNLADIGLIVSSVGAQITSNQPIVAERAMYFSIHRVFDAGTGAMGSPQLATQWQFAESSTGPFFDEFVSLLNPSTTQTATATLTFHLPGGSTLTRSYTVAPERRRTVYLNLEALLDPGLAALQNTTFWLTVDSTIPIASERVMWWPRGTLWYEGHASTGSPASNTSWVVPEGTAGNGGPGGAGASDQTYVLIANTSNAPGQVRLTLIPDSGATSTATLPIAPFERLSVDVASQFSLNNARFSVLVDSLGTPGVPIVVDYARYASPSNTTWAAGGASQAIVAPVQTPVDTAPTVTSTTPANGATNVLLHGNLTVTFSESVSVTPTAFTLQCPVGTPIALTNLTASPGTTFTLDPNVALPQSTTCTLTVVATQVTDTDPNDPPNTMAADHIVTFQTESESAPTVTATTPADGATSVGVASNLTVTFSEPVNVTGSTFVLECPGGTPIALTNLTASPAMTFTLDPNVDLPSGTACTATVVAAQVTDSDAIDPPDTMAANFVFSFTTEACPTITVTPTTLPGASTGTPYSQIFSQTGAPGAVTWSLTGTLPTGMTFNTATGELSGTPTQAGSFPITVTATGAGGCSGSVLVTLSVNCPAITVSPGTLPAGTTGTPYSQTFTQVGSAAAVTWSLSGTLPTGMTFNTATGELSGTPTQAGSFPVTVTATDANGCSGFVAVTLTVNCPVITVSPSTLPDASTGTPYSQVFTQVGTSGTVTWSLSGTLPTGLTFNTATGELSGTPTQTGSFPVTVTATDANGCSGSVSVTLTVTCPTITIGPGTLPNGTTGTTYPATQLTQTGGTLPITWDLASGTLPTGLTLSAGGLVSGTPTAAGTFNFTARATDANGCSGTLAYSVNIVCPTINVTTTGAVPNGVVGQAYGGVTFQQTGGSLPITWSVTAGALPAGLTLNPSTGQITGTPTDDGPFSVTVTATDANGCSGSLTINITVTCPVITLSPGSPLTDGLFNVLYAPVTITANGGATPHTFAVTAGSLPPNMTLATNGQLSGTPSNTGAFTFTVTATDNSSAACAGSQAYALTVRPNAQNDLYNGAVGNTELIVDSTPSATTTPTVVLSGTVLSNDAGPAALSAGPGAITTVFGGSVVLAADGTFLYRPQVGFVGPTDSFVYTLTDGNGIQNTATVTIGVSNIVWYVNSAGTNGDGRSHSPFNTLASAHTSSTVNHHVFVHSGGATTPGDITLESGQTLHGHGSAFTVGALTIPASTHPTLSDSVTLGPNTTVNSLTLSSGTDAALIANNATTGTVNINTVNIVGGLTGLSLTNVPATVNVTNSSFTGISGTDVHINDGSGTVNIGATITNTSGRSVHIQNRDGGTVTFSSAINDTGTGIRLESNNAAHTTHFTGGLTLSTGGNIGLHATSGGIVNVTGSTNTITTGAATALHVEDTTIGTGLTFRSISASGGANGILLDNTGATAGLTVTGTGAANSGGTIQNTTSHGVLMSSTRSPSFTTFRIMNTGGSGVKGTGVTHFTYVNGSISGSNDDGTALANESNLAFHDAVSGTENNLSGDVTITGNSLTTALYHGVDILNHAGTINTLSISNNVITSTTSNVTSQGSGIRLIGWGSAGTSAHVLNANIQNNTITNFPVGAGIVVQGGNANNSGAPSTTMGTAGNASQIVNITGNTISGASAANRINTHAIQAAVNGVGMGNFNISNNGTPGSPIQHVTGNVISHSALGLANVTSVIANNVIVANHTAGVGGAFGISVGSGQSFGASDNATLTTTISGNTISQTDGNGIIASAREASANLVARILNNTVAAPLSGVRPGIRVDSGTAVSTDNSVCLEISGNTSAGSGGHLGLGLRKQGTVSTTHSFAIEGMAATASPGVEAYVDGLNPAGNGTLLISASSGFTSCTAP